MKIIPKKITLLLTLNLLLLTNTLLANERKTSSNETLVEKMDLSEKIDETKDAINTDTVPANFKLDEYDNSLFDLNTQQGKIDAMLSAGDFEASRTDGKQNLIKAIYWFKKAAKVGSPKAMHRLGEYHHFKVGGKRSEAGKAVQWYTRAAQKGYVPSIVNLATLAFIEKRSNDGKMWLKSAALKNDMHSIMTIANHYFTGVAPFEKSLKKAAQYYKQGAKLNNSVAQLRLAIMKIKGLGVEKNLTEAYMWLALAKKSGNEPASHYLQDTLIPMMSKADIVQAKELIKNYQ